MSLHPSPDPRRRSPSPWVLECLLCLYLLARLLKVNLKIRFLLLESRILRLQSRVLRFKLRHSRFRLRKALTQDRREWQLLQYVRDYAHEVILGHEVDLLGRRAP